MFATWIPAARIPSEASFSHFTAIFRTPPLSPAPAPRPRHLSRITFAILLVALTPRALPRAATTPRSRLAAAAPPPPPPPPLPSLGLPRAQAPAFTAAVATLQLLAPRWRRPLPG
jgi:hypothetical protein